jgi:hypothetical protein
LVAALDAYQPQVVLIEGPPEADALVQWVGNPDLQPPVALFAYETTNPENSAFWPFAVFSPEWQAMTWAVRNSVPVRFIDLPAAVVLSESRTPVEEDTDASAAGSVVVLASSHQSLPPRGLRPQAVSSTRRRLAKPSAEDESRPDTSDPFAMLASIAGIQDPERWWDEVIESTPDGDRFAAVAAMMGQLRDASAAEPDPTEARREAQMRVNIRKATKEFDRVAVVCGAWHVPALSEPLPKVSADNALLKGLSKTKVSAAWVPWTHSRLSFRSGYGAGVLSPGWYHHLFTTADQPIITWLTKVAQVLRDRDLPVSSAHIIEATRLAETLAALRGRALPGLGEATEATRAVLCEGDDTMVAYVQRELVVGEEIGTVPADAPLVPLDADMRKTAKTLRLAFSGVEKELVLDRRKDFDRQRSAFLHRLAILGINWGTPTEQRGTGTFKESWSLVWQPEFAVAIAESSRWGTTVPGAAGSRLLADADTLQAASAGIEKSLIADLPQVLDALLAVLDAKAAAEGDVQRLLASVPPLARASRYGTVRETDTAQLADLAHSVLVRGCATFGPQVANLSDDAADDFVILIEEIQRAVGLLPPESAEIWRTTLLEVVDRHDIAALLLGRITRMLLDAGIFDTEELGRRLSLNLTAGHTPAEQARWIEGLLRGDALLLIHDQSLLGILDAWVATLTEEDFIDILPLLRRTFGTFQLPERRQLELRVSHLDAAGSQTPTANVDLELAAPVLATIRLLLEGPTHAG